MRPGSVKLHRGSSHAGSGRILRCVNPGAIDMHRLWPRPAGVGEGEGNTRAFPRGAWLVAHAVRFSRGAFQDGGEPVAGYVDLQSNDVHYF